MTLIGLMLCRRCLQADEGTGASTLSSHTTEHMAHQRLSVLCTAFQHKIFPRGLLQDLQTIKKPHQRAFLPFKLHDRSQSMVLKPSWEPLGYYIKSSLGESPATGNFQAFHFALRWKSRRKHRWWHLIAALQYSGVDLTI